MNQHDRISGVLLGCAAGDALGAPYEFEPPRGLDLDVGMVGGGPWEVGEWTDDTSMAIVIAQVAATGIDLRHEAALDMIVQRWKDWSTTAKDVGVQTSSVLHRSDTANTAWRAAANWYATSPGSCGNGALMRTAPVALAYLHDEAAMVHAARWISALTHSSSESLDACVLWCSAIRHAVLTGVCDVRIGLKHVFDQQLWNDRLRQAEWSEPKDFPNNGNVVYALQAAVSAITHSGGQFDVGVEAAVRAGFDTDTVAAIAGSLLGATFGASSIPKDWLRVLHGWPGMNAADLVRLAESVTELHTPISLT